MDNEPGRRTEARIALRTNMLAHDRVRLARSCSRPADALRRWGVTLKAGGNTVKGALFDLTGAWAGRGSIIIIR